MPDRAQRNARVDRSSPSAWNRVEDPVLQRFGAAGVEFGTLGGGGVVVFVLAVLAVEDLRVDDHGGVGVEQFDFERHDGDVLFLEADHAVAGDADLLAARGAPVEAAAQHAVAEVEGTFVVVDFGVAQAQRFVVDVQAHRLGVGGVDDRLPLARKAVGVFGVADVPGFVQAVDERAVFGGIASLGRVGAHADVAVGQGEQGLGHAQRHAAGLGFDQAPFVDGGDVAVHQALGVDEVVVLSLIHI